MSEEIKVHVVDYGKNRNLMMRYLDPISGKQVSRSTGTRNKKEAEREAAKWEDQLREGRYARPNRMTWEAFRDYFREHRLPAMAASSRTTYESTLNVFEQSCNPMRLADVTTAKVTGFVTTLRKDGKEEATTACYLRHLKATMRWAHGEGLLTLLPKFTMPKRVKGEKAMRGRPITGEEFDRMIAAVPKVVENIAAESWKFYLRGLWWSGLRLSESLKLRWDDAPESIVVDFSEARPMLRIPNDGEKGNKDRLLPMAPEFAELLGTVPKRKRTGLVFKLLGPDGSLMDANRSDAGKTVSAIGKSAGVVVDEREKRVKGDGGKKAKATVKKFASAHDLRRGFGARWARRLMPDDLMVLMRHETIVTTMKFYVGQNAQETADRLWAAVGNSSGNTRQAAAGGDSQNTANYSTGGGT